MSTGWEALTAAAAEARRLVAAEASDPEAAAEGQAYVARVLAAGLSGAFLGHHLRRGGLSRALPVHGGPNPDYILLHAPVDPGGRYRLDGRLNGSERVSAGLYQPGPDGTLRPAGYAAFDRSSVGEDDRFTLALAAEATEAGALPIGPATRVLLVRILHRDDSAPAELTFTRAPDTPAPALPAADAEAGLNHVARALVGTVRAYLPWTAAARSLANRLEPAPPELTEAVQGDPDTAYLLGGFDLAEDEWLEVVVPAGAGYWSLHAYSIWFEHLQTPGAHDRNALAGADGAVRIAIGPRRPDAAANWIDTAGRSRGALICRIIGARDRPRAQLRKRAG